MLPKMPPWIKSSLTAVVTITMFVAITGITSASAGQPKMFKRALLACSGNHSSLTNSTTYPMRNYNSNKTIQITRVRIYNAAGGLIFDAPGNNTFPAGFSSVLGPRQSTPLRTTEIFGNVNASGPLQTLVNWKTQNGTRALALRVGVVRVTNNGRHNGKCRVIRSTF